jgi:F-type H+-transporting ATPase subunit delta
MAQTRDIKLAKRLARITVEAGDDRVGELRPALERVIAGRTAKDRKAFLKAFHKGVQRELHKDTLVVESAAALPDQVVEELKTAFGEGHPRPVRIIRKISPDLVAGTRVRLGDSVYESSISGRLQALGARIR